MLKKRLIFTLLYDSGNFMLSRNFNLQRVGDVNWLAENYNFSSEKYTLEIKVSKLLETPILWKSKSKV